MTPADFDAEVRAIQIQAVSTDDASAWLSAAIEYRAATQDVIDRFHEWALDDVGLVGHPRAAAAWEFAWSNGHADGFNDVYYWLAEAADLLGVGS
jgi:hypothetical protein